MREAELFGFSQIRLAELSLFNWGSFHNLHHVRIDPDGTLITGENGSGKSTLIDAYMALFQPIGKALFNVAAAQGRGDRNLVSYMRGDFGADYDGAATKIKSMRDKGVITAIRALFKADDQREITLIALFKLEQGSRHSTDVDRTYLAARKNVALRDVLERFTVGNSRQFNQWVQSQPEIISTKQFNEYQEQYRRLLYMDNKNAPALLTRALGLKKIDDLTKLIRDLVLEPSNIKEQAQKLVLEFSDLVTVHDDMLDQRQQVACLQPLPQHLTALEQGERKQAQLKQQKEALPYYFAARQSEQLTQEQQQKTRELTALSTQLTQQQRKISDAEEQVQQYRDQYMQLGGSAIENLKKQLDIQRHQYAITTDHSQHYQAMCQQLSLPSDLRFEQFNQNQQQANERESDIKRDLEQQKARMSQQLGEREMLRTQLKQLREDLQEVRSRPNSNLPASYQKMRENLANALHLEQEMLPFVGELIDVENAQRLWQGAIERALGGKRSLLLVPQSHYKAATSWLNCKRSDLI